MSDRIVPDLGCSGRYMTACDGQAAQNQAAARVNLLYADHMLSDAPSKIFS